MILQHLKSPQAPAALEAYLPHIIIRHKKRSFVESVKIELGAKRRNGAAGHIPTRGRAGSPRLHRERGLDDRVSRTKA
jgi:hypothetical protein